METARKLQALVYSTPMDYLQVRERFGRLANGLRDSVVLFGSTHPRANWREDPVFYSALGDNAKKAFNPKVPPDVWDDSFAPTEALAMSEAGTILIRLENNEIKNGSLGSVAEAGFAVLSAKLRGQK